MKVTMDAEGRMTIVLSWEEQNSVMGALGDEYPSTTAAALLKEMGEARMDYADEVAAREEAASKERHLAARRKAMQR